MRGNWFIYYIKCVWLCSLIYKMIYSSRLFRSCMWNYKSASDSASPVWNEMYENEKLMFLFLPSERKKEKLSLIIIKCMSVLWWPFSYYICNFAFIFAFSLLFLHFCFIVAFRLLFSYFSYYFRISAFIFAFRPCFRILEPNWPVDANRIAVLGKWIRRL